MKKYLRLLCFAMIATGGSISHADENLGVGDLVKIMVYGNPDLTLETRIDNQGKIRYPLIGEVEIGGAGIDNAESKIASALRKGGFIQVPHVNILLVESRSKLVSIIGKVNKPGRYVTTNHTTLLDIVADAGGIAPGGSTYVTIINGDSKKNVDLSRLVENAASSEIPILNGGEVVYVTTNELMIGGEINRPGKYSITDNVRTLADFIVFAGGVNAHAADSVLYTTKVEGVEVTKSVDIRSLMSTNSHSENVEYVVKAGDKIFVPKAPMLYIYGEVQRPGSYRIEKDMTIMQALVQGGGPSARGTQRGIKVYRTDEKGVVTKLTPNLTDMVNPNDVLYIEESLF